MNEPKPSLRDLFNEAAEIADPAARAAFLDHACGGDAALRQRVNTLLQAFDQAGPFLAEAANMPVNEKPGDRIGRYRLLQVIGEGGWGVVYMAEQEEPVRRKVALKIIKLGMDTKQVIARFEAERQALALMDHPNIAKVFDAGTTGDPEGSAGFQPAVSPISNRQSSTSSKPLDELEVPQAGSAAIQRTGSPRYESEIRAGRPYFVMELVRGLRITDYCAQYQLTTTERLRLFAQVCHAVQHAHQKGIIHRDLKPSNVLVTPNEPDRLGIPKVIDFGIAKATGQELTEKTLFTEFHQFIGTPAYMSPEQAGRSAADIDTRSDIYSLGVLLYELLTGATPFDAKELLSAGLDGMRRTICEVEPVKPSTRVTQELTAARRSADFQSAPAAAGPISNRQAQESSGALGDVKGPQAGSPAIQQIGNLRYKNLIHALRGDLDWIVMKCLEKDRARRYETANGLAMDLQRHLNEEPVLARPPSAGYRFRKFVRRHQAAFATVGAVVLALVLGLMTSVWQAIRATRAEQAAGQSQAGAEQRLYDSLVGEARATRAARRAGYRERVFALLRQARALDVPNQNLDELRDEVVACLGDFVGLTPTVLGEFPTNATIAIFSTAQLDATGRQAGFLLSDGTILLRAADTGEEVARLRAELPAWSFQLDGPGQRMFSVHLPPAASLADRLPGARLHEWIQAEDGRWMENSKAAMPGASDVWRVNDRWLVLICNLDDQVWELIEPGERNTLHRVPFPEPFRLDEWRARPAFSPDARWLAAPAANSVEVWSLAEGRSVARLEPGLFGLGQVAFSADGRFLACLSGRGCAIYSTNGFSHAATLGESANGWVKFAFDGAGRLALPQFEQNRVRLWDALRSKDVAALDVPFAPYRAAFSADGEWLLVAGVSNACVFPAHANSEKLNLAGHELTVTAIAFSPDGSRLASVGRDQTMKLWDAAAGRLLWETGPLPGQGGHAIGFSPDGRFLATGHWSSQRVCVWDAHTGNRLQTLRTSNPTLIGGVGWSVRFSPDGRHLISAHTPDVGTSETVGLMVWPRQPAAAAENLFGEPARTLKAHYHNLTLSPDNRHLACVNFFGEPKLYFWDFTSDAPPRVLTGDILSSGQNLAFTPDGRQLVFLDQRRNVVFFEIATGTSTRHFPTLDGAVADEGWAGEPNLLPSPDGAKLAISSRSQRGVEIWQADTGRRLYALPEQAAAVEWLDWSPDSRRVAVSRSDGTVAIWNLGQVETVLNDLGLNP